MTSVDSSERFPHWAQYFRAEDVRGQIVLGFVAALSSFGFLVVPVYAGADIVTVTGAVAFCAGSLLFLLWMRMYAGLHVAGLCSSPVFSVDAEGRVMTYLDADVVRVRVFLIAVMATVSSFAVLSVAIYNSGDVSDGDATVIRWSWIVTFPLAVLAGVLAWKVPRARIVLTANGLECATRRGRRSQWKMGLFVPWGAVSRVTHADRYSQPYFPNQIVKIEVEPDAMFSGAGRNYVIATRKGWKSISVNFFVTDLNINVASLLITAYLEAHRAGVEMTEEFARELTRIPPLAVQLRAPIAH
ncbi:hypothetical protein [Tomitella gaofuii]|uniref:hypothetical protein n=1 Tax=Tomitella gaofuii TaxID=2760083 RepID=UPI0015FB38BB|nr:hypothetical protein [Tomitella gaofuii]